MFRSKHKRDRSGKLYEENLNQIAGDEINFINLDDKDYDDEDGNSGYVVYPDADYDDSDYDRTDEEYSDEENYSEEEEYSDEDYDYEEEYEEDSESEKSEAEELEVEDVEVEDTESEEAEAEEVESEETETEETEETDDTEVEKTEAEEEAEPEAEETAAEEAEAESEDNKSEEAETESEDSKSEKTESDEEKTESDEEKSETDEEKSETAEEKSETDEEKSESEETKSESTAGEEQEEKKKKWWILWLVLGILLVGGIVGFFVYQFNLTFKTARVEAGVNVEVAHFLTRPDPNAYFTEESDAIDTTKPGEYNLYIKTGFFTHHATLYVQDTIAPELTTCDVEIDYGETAECDDFVENIVDASATEVYFVKEPDFSLIEDQTVTIGVRDAGGNETQADAKLIVRAVVSELRVEAGSKAPSAEDFVLSGDNAKLITDLAEIDFNIVGSNPVQLEMADKIYDIELIVEDTVAPEFEVTDLEKLVGGERDAAEFVTEVNDVTEVTFSFEKDPDLNLIGEQELTIIATDAGGNTTSKTAKLTLAEDTEAPTIKGSDFIAFIGDTITYKSKVKVSDNSGDEPKLTVDSSAVDINNPGDYKVIYTATDGAGNTADLTINVKVRKRGHDEAEVMALVQAIVDDIIKPDMSDYDKCWAIFQWTRSHMWYNADSEIHDWVKAVYDAITYSKGNCYGYQQICRVMFDLCGITNMGIAKIPAKSEHNWNLVDIGDGHGWYHFDATPRKDHPTIFLWDEATLLAYSDSHNKSHNYDRSQYPTVY